MEFNLLRANNGDAIHLRFKDENGDFRNILIDGGTSDTYEFKDATGIQKGELKQTIDDLKNRNEFVDLLIMTHVDDDHIGGVLKWVENDSDTINTIKKVWFNSGRLISEYFGKEEIKENLLRLKDKSSLKTSIKQGICFEDFIEKNAIWDRKIIKSLDEIQLFGLKFTILSPSVKKLESLLVKWKKEEKNLKTSKKNDYRISLKELIEKDTFEGDKSIHNGSSIAFILEYKGNKMLFLGDAHPQDVVDSLMQLGYSVEKPIDAAFVKVSHHGSKANTNDNLLDLINSELFVISSNGNMHQLPDKQCLARIINRKKEVTFLFNYPTMIKQIFTDKDIVEFPGVKALPFNNRFDWQKWLE